MKQYETLDLEKENGTRFFYQPNKIEESKQELQEFVLEEKHMNNISFAKKVMFSHELKANNQVEGYNDDVKTIEEVIKKETSINDLQKQKRILNLFAGYKYILDHSSINKDSLKELYSVLSEGLIESNLLDKMGEYYRTGDVYILQNGRLDNSIETGVNPKNVDRLMDKYFEFQNNNSNDMTENYILSQIMHLYFVYIHPYYDVNGRTSRTLAMWKLLNKESYPYIIFNRGISLGGSNYDQIIRKTIQNNNLTNFIEYMLDTVKIELEKEYVMHSIASSVSGDLTSLDYQTMIYYLSMKGLKTVKDFATIYNRFNDKKTIKEIYETMILPLLDKNILLIDRYTKKMMYEQKSNIVLDINKNYIDTDPNKIRRLTI